MFEKGKFLAILLNIRKVLSVNKLEESYEKMG